MVGWTENYPSENTNYACLQHKNQAESSSNLCWHFYYNSQHILLQFLLTFIKLFQSHSS